MDIGALHVAVHRVAKSWTQLKWFSPHAHSSLPSCAMSPSKQPPCSWWARSGPSNLQGWSYWPVMLAPEQSSHGGPQAHKDPTFAPRCCLPLLSPPYPLSLHCRKPCFLSTYPPFFFLALPLQLQTLYALFLGRASLCSHDLHLACFVYPARWVMPCRRSYLHVFQGSHFPHPPELHPQHRLSQSVCVSSTQSIPQRLKTRIGSPEWRWVGRIPDTASQSQ